MLALIYCAIIVLLAHPVLVPGSDRLEHAVLDNAIKTLLIIGCKQEWGREGVRPVTESDQLSPADMGEQARRFSSMAFSLELRGTSARKGAVGVGHFQME